MEKSNKKSGKKYKSPKKYQSLFASRLRELMDASKMTQDTLAQKIGKTRQTVSQYANGDSEPGYSTLVKIAEIFNTTTDYLLGVTNAKSISTDERTIVDKTGLSSSSIDTLGWLLESNKRNWYLDVFNAIIEHKEFTLFLALATDITSLKDKDKKMPAKHFSNAFNYSGGMKIVDVLQYQLQTVMSEIIRDIAPQFESKDDDRWQYDFVFSAYKEGKITKEKYEYHCKKLDNGDYSEFQTEVKSNG